MTEIKNELPTLPIEVTAAYKERYQGPWPPNFPAGSIPSEYSKLLEEKNNPFASEYFAGLDYYAQTVYLSPAILQK